ncbi:TerB family tellurite resistance protein [Roseicitreum antarcticum]|uniref:Uncharacterized conserved protein, tellurite resistance protein B (TerB) family n=1 Tax=Roseicitreum antarcticum TaxID=564137 RepID=A0A1H2ZW27_9RHOB|nr:TerB family tellurite resistance protein [Roseicitreum antarcticum]SDX21760.1 Uncharacterized conserved protein, tellurite resistance protein B (TerB) family [Roseicitreum antarcticum]
MIDVLKGMFGAGRAASRDEVAPDVAVCAVLIEAARADGSYDDAERIAVGGLLADMFDLNPDAALALRAQGEVAQAEASDIVRFTRVTKSALSDEDRVALIEGLWQVVLVDHHRDPHESALMRHIAPLLAVSDHESAAARQRVLARAG